jgi:hypothetical protein
VKAAVAQAGVQSGTPEFYELLAREFSRHGLLDAADKATQAGEALKGRRAQTELYTAQAEKAKRVSSRDAMTERYWRVVEQLQNEGEHQSPHLVQARDNLGKALGLKPDAAPKQESADWQLVQPTAHSPGYSFNRRTGEERPLRGRIPKPSEAPSDDDSPFADLTPEARKAAERAAGKETASWVGGDRATALRGVEALRDVKAQLASNPDIVDDPLSSRLPDAMRAMTPGGRAALQARDQVRQAIQSTLRATLGAQFTQQEGEALMNRAFDPKLTAEQNIDRLERAIQELADKIEARDSLSRNRRPQERAPRQPNGNGANSGTVKVRLPDGRTGNIPRANLAAARARGAVEIR